MSDRPFAELNPSQSFEYAWNRLQMVIEIAVGLIVLAGLAGLLGTGPFSSTKQVFDGLPLSVTYDRIQRRTVQTEIKLETTGPLPSGVLEVTLPNQFTEAVDVVSTSPRSVTMRAEPYGITYDFAFGPARRGVVTFSIKPRRPGVITAVVRSGSAAAPFDILVLP